MEGKSIEELQNEIQKGEEAKRQLIQRLNEHLAGSSSNQPALTQGQDQVSCHATTAPTAAKTEEAQTGPQYPPQHMPYHTVALTSAPNTQSATNRVQQPLGYYNSHSYARPEQQQMQLQQTQNTRTTASNHSGQGTRHAPYLSQSQRSSFGNVEPQRYSSLPRMVHPIPQPPIQRPSVMQQMGSIQHTPQSDLRRRQHPQQLVDVERVYEPMQMERQQAPRGLPNTALVPIPATNRISMSSHQSVLSYHPSNTAEDEGKRNLNEVVAISASSRNSSSQPSNSLADPVVGSIKQSNLTSGSALHSLPSSSLAASDTQADKLRIPEHFIYRTLHWDQQTEPGSIFSDYALGLQVMKTPDGGLHLISSDGKGGKCDWRIDSWRTMRIYSHDNLALQQNRQDNLQSFTGPLAERRTKPQSFQVLPQRPSGADGPLRSPIAWGQYKQGASSSSPSKQSSSPRTPMQADKKSLAKDILRALHPSEPEKLWTKRPRSEDGSTTHSQPPGKRHAREPGVEASSTVGFPSTSTNQRLHAGPNGVVVPPAAARPSVASVSAGDALALMTPGEQYAPPFAQHLLSRKLPVLPSTQIPPSTSVKSTSQTTAQHPTSLRPPVELLASALAPSASTPTLLVSQTPSQNATDPSSSGSRSHMVLPVSHPVKQSLAPFTTSSGEPKLSTTTSKTPIQPRMELLPSSSVSTSPPAQKSSTLLPKRKPPIRSDSVPAIATLSASPPALLNIDSNSDIMTQTFTPRRRSPLNIQQAAKRQTTPLFLPSPTSSRSPSELIDDSADTPVSEDPLQIGGLGDIAVDLNIIKLQKLARSKATIRTRPYVLVPPWPPYLILFKARESDKVKRRNARIQPVLERQVFGSDQRSTSRHWEEPDINYADPANFDFVNDDAEREAMVLSCSRLSERPCKWNGCDVVMDSAEKLIKHFASEHRPRKTSKNSFVCHWQQCGKRLPDAKRLFIHLRSHATTPLSCGYRKCDEYFRNPIQLAKHHEAEHKDSSPKAAAAFFAPVLSSPPVAPRILPSYMVEARQVRQPLISKERHASLVPWVLRKIAGPVNIGTKQYNAAKPLRSANGAEERRGTQPYDFLTFPSVQYSSVPSQPSKIRSLDDLDSGEVSEMANDGMILWYEPDMKREEESSSDEMMLYSKDQGRSISNEEVVVETMLTG